MYLFYKEESGIDWEGLIKMIIPFVMGIEKIAFEGRRLSKDDI